jgi:hypothetical protein
MASALQQRDVQFYDDQITAVQADDGVVFVLFAKVCQNLGLDRSSQVRRIKAHAVLNEGLITLSIQSAGGPQSAQCLRLDLLPLWLSGVQARKASADMRERLIRYQREAGQVLWQAFKHQIQPTTSDNLIVSDDHELAQLQQMAEMGRAITRMAEEQIELRRRMDAAARAYNAMRYKVNDIQVRLGLLEDRLHPTNYITPEQAAAVSQWVKAIAQELTNRDPSKNHYQAVFSELYRRFDVSSYKMIRLEQYASVLSFLEEWHKTLL